MDAGTPLRTPPCHSGKVALHETWLAEAYATSGNVDAARVTIQRAHRAADAVNSTRLDRRVSDVERILESA
ncbi:hypothetical protein [Nocardia thraciensis]